MKLDTLLSALEQPTKYTRHPDLLTSEITSLAYDSRNVEAGGLFIAIPGVHTDGRRFLGDAVARGAVVALGEPLQSPVDVPLPYVEVADARSALADLACAFYNYPAQHLCTIGVTGTDGKTTTSNLISTLLETAGKRSGLMTTANFKIRGQEWENATRQSTLEALEIQQLLRRMLDGTAARSRLCI
jgi:UDP-N-acetylmuramoyl-L-alanyl-D-glutamate--2,6-diaminopimelate ligase